MSEEITISVSQYKDLIDRAKSLIECRSLILYAMADVDGNLFDKWINHSMGNPENTVEALKELIAVLTNHNEADEILQIDGDSIEAGDYFCHASAVKQSDSGMWVSFTEYIDIEENLYCAPPDEGLMYDTSAEALDAANKTIVYRLQTPERFDRYYLPVIAKSENA
ncbi:hypothetical protein KC887_02515 [Candidatus Kaiserbacteria bacterium]|nr:hypothetical protein [Candidatus Kaiserbacteria bacterium]